MHAAPDLPDDDRLALVVLAVLQALGLLALHKAIVHDAWPATDPRWLYALYAAALGLPGFLYLGAARWRDRANALAAGALALLLSWAGWHAGWLIGTDASGDDRLRFVPQLALSLLPALFLAALYFRAWREAGALDYPRLLDLSWRNALTVGFLLAFVLAFELLLLLWAQLFKVIGIDLFVDLFSRAEFNYPVLGLVGGFGLGLVRARVGMVATVRRLCEALIRALLPLAAFVVVIFLATLPSTGLEALWRTGHASLLLMSLATVLLFAFNATLADDEALALPEPLRVLVLVALVMVPANAALTARALALRVEQYGWTEERLWGLLVLASLAAYSVGLAAIVLRWRAVRIAPLRRLNLGFGAALALALLATNTPLLEFHRIAAADQVARLRDGRTAPADFDAPHLRWELGPYGREALTALAADPFVAAHPDLEARIAEALAAESRWAPHAGAADPARLRARVVARAGTELDEAFLAALAVRDGKEQQPDCLGRSVRCAVGEVVRGGVRYRLLTAEPAYLQGVVWREAAAGWTRIGALRIVECAAAAPEHQDGSAPLALVDAGYFVVDDGRCLYQVLPTREALRPAAR
jgi:hypothetical protein